MVVVRREVDQAGLDEPLLALHARCHYQSVLAQHDLDQFHPVCDLCPFDIVF